MPYRTIIVGTDGSETASKAVRHAGGLAKTTGGRVVVVTAFEDRHQDATDDAPEDIRWMLTDQGEAERLAQAGRHQAAESGAEHVIVQAVRGEPASQLLEAADTFDADLIVVGSVGLAGAARFVLGSVASTVSHHAPCDVLVVHTTD